MKSNLRFVFSVYVDATHAIQRIRPLHAQLQRADESR